MRARNRSEKAFVFPLSLVENNPSVEYHTSDIRVPVSLSTHAHTHTSYTNLSCHLFGLATQKQQLKVLLASAYHISSTSYLKNLQLQQTIYNHRFYSAVRSFTLFSCFFFYLAKTETFSSQPFSSIFSTL